MWVIGGETIKAERLDHPLPSCPFPFPCELWHCLLNLIMWLRIEQCYSYRLIYNILQIINIENS